MRKEKGRRGRIRKKVEASLISFMSSNPVKPSRKEEKGKGRNKRIRSNKFR